VYYLLDWQEVTAVNSSDINAEKIVRLARETYSSDDLFEAEIAIIKRSCEFETPTDWRPTAKSFDPKTLVEEVDGARTCTQDRVVRSSFVRWLLSSRDVTELIEPSGVRIYNASFNELLDLRGCRTQVRIELRYCAFMMGINLVSAEAAGFYLLDSWIETFLDASRMVINGPLFISNITALRRVQFDLAKVTAEVLIAYSRLNDPGEALSLGNAVVTTDVILTPSLESAGSMNLQGMQIGGSFFAQGIKVEAKTGFIALDRSVVKGIVHFNECRSSIPIRMLGADIGNQFSCIRGEIRATSDIAISLDQSFVRGGVFLRNATLNGSFHLIDGKVAGQMDLSEAVLVGSSDSFQRDAFILDQSDVNGSVFLTGAHINGRASLRGSKIKGEVSFRKAEVTNTRECITAENCELSGDLSLSDGFACDAYIGFTNARIGGNVLCIKCKIGLQGKLSLEFTSIEGSLRFGEGSECLGELRLLQTTVRSQIDFQKMAVGYVLAERLRVSEGVFWRSIKNAQKVRWNLNGADIGTIHIDKASWPAKGLLQQSGLKLQDLRLYNPIESKTEKDDKFGLANGNRTDEWISWLNLQPDHEITDPKAWMLLADLLDSEGRKRDSKRVVRELRMRQAESNWKGRRLRRPGVLWSKAIALLEEQPLRIALPIFLCVSIGATVFSVNSWCFVPSSETAFAALTKDHKLPAGYPQFQPVVYATENVLPIIKLGQDQSWSPNSGDPYRPRYWFLMSIRWFLIFAGWAQGLILVSAISGRFRSS
jgi:hypothetical protein